MRRSKITKLPVDVKQWLDKSLADGNFSGYAALSLELKKRGYDVGKSSVHRHGQNLERKLAAIKASTEAARMIAAEAPDDADHRSAAVMSMIQTEVFDVLVALQDSERETNPMARAKLLSQVAKNVATLSRASVNQKKHEIEVRAKVEAAADRVTKLARRQGLTAISVDNIRREILGIAG